LRHLWDVRILEDGDNGHWNQRGELLESDNHGEVIDVSKGGKIIAVGNPIFSEDQGSACIYRWN